MKPLLASLVLLLLALCRPTSSACTKAALDATDKFTEKNDLILSDKFGDLLNLGYAVQGICGAPSSDPALEKIGKNGILCTLEHSNAAEMKNVIYGTKDRSPKEDLLAKDLGIDCAAAASASEESKCYCGVEKNTIMWCAALKYKAEMLASFTRGPCKKEALKALTESGNKVLGKHFDYTEVAQHKDKSALEAVFAKSANAIDAITTWAGNEMDNFFCDATNPDVESKLLALYASDTQFQLAETLVVMIAFRKDGLLGLKAACKVPEFTSTTFGECVCSFTRGFAFCVYKALGKEFEKAGFLDCKTNKFVPDKKPAVVPDLLVGQGSPATTPSKDAASPATTASSLMMVPLMAAAVLLARH